MGAKCVAAFAEEHNFGVNALRQLQQTEQTFLDGNRNRGGKLIEPDCEHRAGDLRIHCRTRTARVAAQQPASTGLAVAATS